MGFPIGHTIKGSFGTTFGFVKVILITSSSFIAWYIVSPKNKKGRWDKVSTHNNHRAKCNLSKNNYARAGLCPELTGTGGTVTYTKGRRQNSIAQIKCPETCFDIEVSTSSFLQVLFAVALADHSNTRDF